MEALPKDKSAYSTSVAAKAVSFCDSIYHEEKKLAAMSADERYEQRLVKVKPLLDAFFSWLEKQNVSGKGKRMCQVKVGRRSQNSENAQNQKFKSDKGLEANIAFMKEEVLGMVTFP